MPTIPRVLLHLEGALVFGVSVWLYTRYGSGWLMFAALILAPDVSLLGYLVNADFGAKFYNGAHTYVGPAFAAVLAMMGLLPWGAPIVWAAHIGADRALGFGLKYPGASFKDTHMQRV